MANRTDPYECSAHLVNCALTKHAAQLTKLSIAQHLTNCAIFGHSRTALAIGLRLGLGLGLVLELGLGKGSGLHNWPNAERV